uniref:Uncharacterized protein n=1 Tax=Vespula pensylvanica TaxID=30213 RepID=A0A834N284_VESPE|nr:hypothetical protein H0235_017343 [Vespula pensylvanica]
MQPIRLVEAFHVGDFHINKENQCRRIVGETLRVKGGEEEEEEEEEQEEEEQEQEVGGGRGEGKRKAADSDGLDQRSINLQKEFGASYTWQRALTLPLPFAPSVGSPSKQRNPSRSMRRKRVREGDL